MKELRRKQAIKRWLYSYPSLVVVLIMTGFLIKGALGLMIIERENAHRVGTLEQESERLVGREAELVAEVAKLKTDEGIIEAIKEKFSVTRTGEYVAVIVDERAKATSTSQGPKTWYQKLWNAIISPPWIIKK